MDMNYDNPGNGAIPSMPPFPSSSASTAETAASVASYACPSCGIDQQRLALLQEHVSLEEQLLKEDKRNFKRRLKAAKATARKTQVHAENQLLLADKQMRECEQKIKTSKDEIEVYKLQLERAEQDMEKLAQKLQAEQQHHEQELAELKRQQQNQDLQPLISNDSTLMVQEILQSVALDGDVSEQVIELKRQLDEKQSDIDGYEMQLLEMERELDLLRSLGEELSTVGGNDSDECQNCQLLQSKMSRMEQEALRQKENFNKQGQSQLYELQQQAYASQKATADAEEARKELEVALQDEIEAKRQLEAENAALLEKLIAQQRLDEPDEEIDGPDTSRLADTVTTISGNETVLTLATEADTIVSTAALSPLQGNDDDDKSFKHENNGLRTIQEHNDCSPVQPVRCLSLHPAPSTNTFLVFEKEYHGSELVGMYTGQMANSAAANGNVPHGLGTLRLDDGAVMDGTWESGFLQGNGVLATIDGDVYHGGWDQGKKHGLGTLVYSDGRVYRGSFVNDHREGHGYITWPYGAHYQGEFRNDKRNGAGEYRYADGRTYSGMYLDDRPHGYGVLRARDNSTIYDGQWELGEFLGDGKH